MNPVNLPLEPGAGDVYEEPLEYAVVGIGAVAGGGASSFLLSGMDLV